jgi:hypothetical protein
VVSVLVLLSNRKIIPSNLICQETV